MQNFLHLVSQALNSHVDEMITASWLPFVSDAKKAMAAIVTIITLSFGAGIGFSAFFSGFKVLPQRVDVLEQNLIATRTEVQQTRRDVCEIKMMLENGDPVSCYRGN
jgi:hypothetical protein